LCGLFSTERISSLRQAEVGERALLVLFPERAPPATLPATGAEFRRILGCGGCGQVLAAHTSGGQLLAVDQDSVCRLPGKVMRRCCVVHP
jgi:hypothetical protein